MNCFLNSKRLSNFALYLRTMKGNYFYILVLLLILTSCGEYNKLLKSNDYNLKYDYAHKYYQSGRYTRAITLFEELAPVFKGKEKGEESLYMLAKSYEKRKDFVMASHYYTNYYTAYPKGKYSEDARYNAAYCYYKDVPDPRLDQSSTFQALEELQTFLEYYPRSEKADQARELLFELQEQLAEKALNNVKLYYNLGNYLGNNYLSAIVTAKNALQEYPYSKYKENFSYYILRAKFAMAEQSVEEKKEDRFRDVIDEYYAFINDYPESVNLNEAKLMFEKSSKKITKDTKKEQ